MEKECATCVYYDTDGQDQPCCSCYDHINYEKWRKSDMTLADAIRKMTDQELCEFIYGMQIAIIRKFAQTFDVEIEEEIEAEKKEMFDGIAEKLKTEI